MSHPRITSDCPRALPKHPNVHIQLRLDHRHEWHAGCAKWYGLILSIERGLGQIGFTLGGEAMRKRSYRRFGEKDDRWRRRRAWLLVALTIPAAVVYFALLPGGLNPDHSFIGILFLFAEAMCLGLFVLSATDVWRLRYKPPTGVDLEALGTVSVDVFITACGEPTEVVEKTLRAAAELEWGGPLQAYVLDDGGSGDLRRIARELGFTYLSRKQDAAGGEPGKAGNLNFGLERSEGELILVLDADQVPIPAAIRLMAGYLRFPSVAFIQSKQTFWVPEGDPFNSQDTVFYDTVQLAFDADDSVISCGSGVIYRRRALEEIGGFVTWNLVEDLTTSYELHSRGWKSLYFPYPVSIGVAPLTIRDVYRQRSQWGLDSMRLFFWDNPLFKKGLKWQARLNHLVVGTSYIWAGFAMPIFFLIPPWTYLTGNPLIVNSELEIVISRLVYFVLYALSAEHLYRGRNPGKQFQFLAGMFPVYLWSTIKALVYPPGRRPRYQVSNIRREDRRGVLLVSLVPQLAVFAANAVLPFYAIYMVTSNPWIIAANALVSCFVLWTLWPLITESLRARAPRALPTGGISVELAS